MHKVMQFAFPMFIAYSLQVLDVGCKKLKYIIERQLILCFACGLFLLMQGHNKYAEDKLF
jgi:hypothetical protein